MSAADADLAVVPLTQSTAHAAAPLAEPDTELVEGRLLG
jgi:hypothetical protein